MADTIDTSKINIDSTFSMAQSQTPSEDHSLFAFKIGSDGKPEKGTQGWYTIKALIAALGKVATDAEAGAIDAKEAAELALADCEAALTAIGQDDSSGARGQAITAISTALFNALASIGQSDTAGARGDAIAAIARQRLLDIRRLPRQPRPMRKRPGIRRRRSLRMSRRRRMSAMQARQLRES